jgi:hypothetical protein
MGRIFGFLCLVISVWIAMTLYSEGIERSFGGVFSDVDEDKTKDSGAYVVNGRSLPQRFGDRVKEHLEVDVSRTERIIDE